MADNNVQVIFSAEWDGLITATKESSAAVTSFSKTVNDSLTNVSAVSTKSLAPLQNFRPNVTGFNAASGAFKQVEEAATHAGHGTAGFYRELLVLGHEMAMGNYTRFGGSMMVLAERSGSLVTIFEKIGALATPMNLAIAGSVAVLGVFAIKAEEAAESLAHIRAAMASVGNEYLFDPQQVEAMSRSLENLAGVGAKDANAMMHELATSTDMTRAELDKIEQSLPDLVTKFGSAENAGKGLKEAIDDPAGAVRRLHDELARNAPEILNQAEDFLAMGEKAQASQVLIDYLTESSKGLHEKGLTPLASAWELVKAHMQEVIGLSAPLLGELMSIANLAGTAASSTLHLAEALGKMRPGVVGLEQVLKATAVQNAGQSYNMDKSDAYIEQQKRLNQSIADGDDLIRKLGGEKLDGLHQQLQRLQKDMADAQSKGDTEAVARFSTGIAEIQKKIAEDRLRTQKQAESAQLQEWEGTLTAQLEQQKLFGEKAKAFELQYWQQKQALAIKGTEEYRQIADKIYAIQSENYQKDVAAQKEAERKKTEAAKKEYENNTQSALKYFDDLAALYKNDYQKLVQIEQQKKIFITARYGQASAQEMQQQTKIDQIEQQHLDKRKQQWTSAIGGIKSAFNSGIMGMIQGTETFGQAIGNVFLSMGQSVVGVLEDIAEKWLITELVGDTASKTQAMSGIAASAAQAGAAAFASTAAIPIVGPELAPAAGAAAYAGAIAYEGLASFDVGSWNLPSDQIAKVHKGEMIIPRTFADDLRSKSGGLGGGGDTHMHFHGTVIDRDSVKGFFLSNSHHVAAATAKAHRNGNRDLRGMK